MGQQSHNMNIAINLKKVKQLNQVQCNDLAEKQNYQSRDKATRDSTKRIETKFRGYYGR